MKSFIYTLLLIASLCSLASCEKSESSEPETPQTADKTIFVFMPYTGENNSLYSNFITNIGDMERAIIQKGGLGNNHLVVFIAKNKQTSSLIDIKYNGKQCVRDTIATYNTPSYLTIDGRTALLNQVKICAPANNYAMIVGCHGEGWLPTADSQKKVATRFFGGETTDYQINIADLAQSISNSDIKLQYVLFDDCYLSCMEVAYDLRNVTNHIIACTSEIMAYGMPYYRIFPYLLQSQPDYEAVCSEFYEFYKNYDMPFGTIGITDCSYVDEMARLMKEINNIHTINADDIEKIQDLDVAHFTPTVYFDFGDYVKYLCGEDTETYSKFTSVLEKMVPYKACTERIYSYSGRKAIKVNAFSGITISDPSLNQRVVDTKTQTQWWKATHN